MSGLLQLIFILLYVISYPFINKEYNDSITNSVYNFEVDDNKKQSNDKDNKKDVIDKNINSSRSIVSPERDSEGNNETNMNMSFEEI